MNRSRRRWLIGLVVLAIVAGNALFAFCWWHNVWSLDAWRVYQAMDHECHPAWRDYHFGRVRPGDPVEDVIARTEPIAVERKGRWTFLKYQRPGFTGMGAIAYDGRMVSAAAASCCWVRLFFDEMTDAQCRELGGHSRAAVDDQYRRLKVVVIK